MAVNKASAPELKRSETTYRGLRRFNYGFSASTAGHPDDRSK
jgi:hypothetical protein